MDTEELERPETNFALRTVPAFSKRSFGRSSKRATDALPVESRAIAGLEERSKAEMAGSVAMAVTGLVGVRLLGGGLYHSIKTVVDHSKSQRDVSWVFLSFSSVRSSISASSFGCTVVHRR